MLGAAPQTVPGARGFSRSPRMPAPRRRPGPRTGGGLCGHGSLPCFRLRPFTSYKLRLKATNDIGDSDFSAETEAVTTLQDGEQGAHFPLPPLRPGTPAPRETHSS